MNNINRGSNKDMYLNSPKRSDFEQKSGLASLKMGNVNKRIFTFQGGKKLDAEHVVIKGSDVQTKTSVHELNPRNQEALDEKSMSDILQQISERGIDTEGIAVRRNGIYYLIEGSRRRYCCIKLNVDFPLWVLPDDLSNDDILAIITAAQSSRKFSYREVGKQYLELMELHGFSTNEQLAQYLNLSTESVRKRVQAAQIDPRLVSLFPDYEGIPNNFYSRLAKIENIVIKEFIDIDELIFEVSKNYKFDETVDLRKTQKELLDKLLFSLDLLTDKVKAKSTWCTSDLISFDNKDQYARVSRSYNGRKVRFEFNRLNKNLIDEIERLIKLKLDKTPQNHDDE